MQRGFLRGRSMLANIIEIDEAAMTISLKEKYGGLVLFDFTAAFPSESHEFLFQTLEHLGMPRKELNLLKMLYDNNKCEISFQGNTTQGFDILAGMT